MSENKPGNFDRGDFGIWCLNLVGLAAWLLALWVLVRLVKWMWQ